MQALHKRHSEHSLQGLSHIYYSFPVPFKEPSHTLAVHFRWVETLDPLMSIDSLPPPSFNHIQYAWSVFLDLCPISPSHSSPVPVFASQDAPENLPKLCQSSFPRAGPYLLTPSSTLTPTSIWIDCFEM